MFGNIYSGRRVLVTGHSGFKGSWLSLWLLELGAEVAGYSLSIPSEPSNFGAIGLQPRIRNYWGDIRDRDRLEEAFDDFRPEIVFHLAAQSLVRRAYVDPAGTFEVNTIGTMNVLECIRQRPSVSSAVIITSDKCYQNVEWVWGYRETDVLGGDDPYSGSKACAELVCSAYIHSFFEGKGAATGIATARAGNVIGGGDWAEDRIIPDCVRSWSKGETVIIRSPKATRPWQHVLEPLSGYLWLGSNLWRRKSTVIGASYNFGPPPTVDHPVEELVQSIHQHWPAANWTVGEWDSTAPPEANLLKLSSDKALEELGWSTTLVFDQTVQFTSEWYQKFYDNVDQDLFEFSQRQIADYCRLAKEKSLAWTRS